MIIINVFSGNQHVKRFGLTEITEENVIREYIQAVIEKGLRWVIDYSAATDDEVQAWLSIDINMRVGLALLNGKTVKLSGREFTASDTEEAFEACSQIFKFVNESFLYFKEFEETEDSLGIITMPFC